MKFFEDDETKESLLGQGRFGIGDSIQKPEESSILARVVKDPIVGIAKGVAVGVPEAAYGIGQLVTGGLLGKGAEAISKATGLKTPSEKFSEWNEAFYKKLTPETQRALQEVQEAEGFLPTAGAYLKNPSALAQGVAENLPGMFLMASIGRGLMKAAGKEILGKTALAQAVEGLPAEAAQKIVDTNMKRAILAASVGEGVYSAGQNIAQSMEMTGTEGMSPQQIGLIGVSGILTGAISKMSAGLARRFKWIDPDVLLQGVSTAELATTGGKLEVAKKIISAMLASAISEGAIEELPQSMQEAYFQNVAMGKQDPWEGVIEQGAQGLLIGGAMGALGVGAAKMLEHHFDPINQRIEQNIKEQNERLKEQTGIDITQLNTTVQENEQKAGLYRDFFGEPPEETPPQVQQQAPPEAARHGIGVPTTEETVPEVPVKRAEEFNLLDALKKVKQPEHWVWRRNIDGQDVFAYLDERDGDIKTIPLSEIGDEITEWNKAAQETSDYENAENTIQLLQSTWYRGESMQTPEGDEFYSASKDVADSFGPVKELKKLPSNPLIVRSKEDLAPLIGYKGDPLAEPVNIPKNESFDYLAKNYAAEGGFDGIVYVNGTFGAPELHVLGTPKKEVAPVAKTQEIKPVKKEEMPVETKEAVTTPAKEAATENVPPKIETQVTQPKISPREGYSEKDRQILQEKINELKVASKVKPSKIMKAAANAFGYKGRKFHITQTIPKIWDNKNNVGIRDTYFYYYPNSEVAVKLHKGERLPESIDKVPQGAVLVRRRTQDGKNLGLTFFATPEKLEMPAEKKRTKKLVPEKTEEKPAIQQETKKETKEEAKQETKEEVKEEVKEKAKEEVKEETKKEEKAKEKAKEKKTEQEIKPWQMTRQEYIALKKSQGVTDEDKINSDYNARVKAAKITKKNVRQEILEEVKEFTKNPYFFERPKPLRKTSEKGKREFAGRYTNLVSFLIRHGKVRLGKDFQDRTGNSWLMAHGFRSKDRSRELGDIPLVASKKGKLAMDEAASLLNSEGFVSPDGKPFTDNSLFEVLASGKGRNILHPSVAEKALDYELGRKVYEWAEEQANELLEKAREEATPEDIEENSEALQAIALEEIAGEESLTEQLTDEEFEAVRDEIGSFFEEMGNEMAAREVEESIETESIAGEEENLIEEAEESVKTELTEVGEQSIIPGASEAETFFLTPKEPETPLVKGAKLTPQNLQPREKNVDMFTAEEPATTPVRKPLDTNHIIKESATEDSGEELKYNKRNRIRRGLRWEDIADKDAALKVKETTKQNVYPKPDYEQLIENGMPPIAAFIVKQVYDSISPTPMVKGTISDEVLRQYIDTVNKIMNGVIDWGMDAKSNSGLLEKYSSYYGKLEGREVIDPLRFIFGESKDYSWSHIVGWNKILHALQPRYKDIRTAEKNIKAGWPKKMESWQKRGLRIIERDNFDIVQYTGPYNNPVFVAVIEGHSFGGRYKTREDAQAAIDSMRPFILINKFWVQLGQFDTIEEAQEAARNKVKRESQEEVSEKGKKVEEAERIGPPRREPGENITSERLMNTFGFKGVNFGNWMKGASNEKERQLHLNHAYDSFMDLAEILNIPPRAVSLNGFLGIAFGAQGSGKHAAHFVPGLNEINITRRTGAGAIAHEWGHALDHYFAVQAGLERAKNPFLSAHVSMLKNIPETIRPEIVDLFGKISLAMNKKDVVITPEQQAEQDKESLEKAKTQVQKWIKSIKADFSFDKEKDKELEERFDKLADRIMNRDWGGNKIVVSRNTYLYPVVQELRKLYEEKRNRIYDIKRAKDFQSNIDFYNYLATKSTAEHIPQEKTILTDYYKESAAKDKHKKPYWNLEQEKFARAFDAFITDSVKEKAAKNTYLSGIETIPPRGEERKAINDAIGKLVEEIKTRETDKGVEIYSRIQELSRLGRQLTKEELAEYTDKLIGRWTNTPPVVVVNTVSELPFDALEDAKGIFHKGKIFLVAGNILDTEDANEVIFHEVVGHYGLRGFFGNTLDSALDDIHLHNPLIKQYAMEWRKNNLDLKEKYSMTEVDYWYRSIEEAMARMAQENKPYTFADKLINAIQSLLRKIGMDKLADTLEAKTNAEALKMLNNSRLYIKEGVMIDSKTPNPLYPMYRTAARYQRLSYQIPEDFRETTRGEQYEQRRQAPNFKGQNEERNSVLSKISQEHARRVGTQRQIISEDIYAPVALREACKRGEGIIHHPEMYGTLEYGLVSELASEYGIEVIPIRDTSRSIHAQINGENMFFDFSAEDDELTLEEVALHEISHHLHQRGFNLDNHDCIDIYSEAFNDYLDRVSLLTFGIENYEKGERLPDEYILEEYVADVESGIKYRLGIFLEDGFDESMPPPRLLPEVEKIRKRNRAERKTVLNFIQERAKERLSPGDAVEAIEAITNREWNNKSIIPVLDKYGVKIAYAEKGDSIYNHDEKTIYLGDSESFKKASIKTRKPASVILYDDLTKQSATAVAMNVLEGTSKKLADFTSDIGSVSRMSAPQKALNHELASIFCALDPYVFGAPASVRETYKYLLQNGNTSDFLYAVMTNKDFAAWMDSIPDFSNPSARNKGMLNKFIDNVVLGAIGTTTFGRTNLNSVSTVLEKWIKYVSPDGTGERNINIDTWLDRFENSKNKDEFVNKNLPNMLGSDYVNETSRKQFEASKRKVLEAIWDYYSEKTHEEVPETPEKTPVAEVPAQIIDEGKHIYIKITDTGNDVYVNNKKVGTIDYTAANGQIEINDIDIKSRDHLIKTISKLFADNPTADTITGFVKFYRKTKDGFKEDLTGTYLNDAGADFRSSQKGVRFILNRDTLANFLFSINSSTEEIKNVLNNEIKKVDDALKIDEKIKADKYDNVAKHKDLMRLMKAAEKWTFSEEIYKLKSEIEESIALDTKAGADTYGNIGRLKQANRIIEGLSPAPVRYMRAGNFEDVIFGSMKKLFPGKDKAVSQEQIDAILKEVSKYKGFDKQFFRMAFSLPYQNAQRDPLDWERVYKSGENRIERREQMVYDLITTAEKFLNKNKYLKAAGYTKEQIKDATERIEKIIILGDEHLRNIVEGLKARHRAMMKAPLFFSQEDLNKVAAEIARYQSEGLYHKEDLLGNGIRNDGMPLTDEDVENGVQGIKLNELEHEILVSVRNTMDKALNMIIRNLREMAIAQYKSRAWYGILRDIALYGIGVDTAERLLRNSAASRSQSVDIRLDELFRKLNKEDDAQTKLDIEEKRYTELTKNEEKNVLNRYKKILDNATEEMTALKNYIADKTGLSGKILEKATREIYVAYQRTRPNLKIISDIRNQWNEWVGYFPRERKQGKFEFIISKNYVGKNMEVKKKPVFSAFFDGSKKEAGDLLAEAMQKLKVDYFGENYSIDIKPVIKGDELYEGLNNANIQNIITKAIKEIDSEEFSSNRSKADELKEEILQATYDSIATQLSARGAAAHRIHRKQEIGEKAIKGYQENMLDRVLMSYIQTTAGFLSKQSAMFEMFDTLTSLNDPTRITEIKAYVKGQMRNETQWDRLSSKLRSMAFLVYLGGLIKSAAVNGTQPFIVGLPMIARYMREKGIKGSATKAQLKASYDTAKNLYTLLYELDKWEKITDLTDAEKTFIQESLVNGHMAAQQIRLIEGEISDANSAFTTIFRWLAKPFSTIEQLNRISTGLATFRMAYSLYLKDKTLSEAEAFEKAMEDSTRMINDVHYPIGKHNLPLFAMGGDVFGVGLKTSYVFRTFTHNFLLNQFNMLRSAWMLRSKEALRIGAIDRGITEEEARRLATNDLITIIHTFAIMGFFGGLLGLPFYKDLFDFAERKLGHSPRLWLQDTLKGIGGDTLATIGLYGMPALLGGNISGSLAIGVPFMGEPTESIFGVWSGVFNKLEQAGLAAGRGDLYRVLANLTPEFLRNPIVALNESDFGKKMFGFRGIATTTHGKPVLSSEGKPLSMTGGEALLKSMGFVPTRISVEKSTGQSVSNLVSWANNQKQSIAESYRIDKIQGDKNAIKKLITSIKELNTVIRSQKIPVTPLNITTVMESARGKLSAQQKRELNKRKQY